MPGVIYCETVREGTRIQSNRLWFTLSGGSDFDHSYGKYSQEPVFIEKQLGGVCFK